MEFLLVFFGRQANAILARIVDCTTEIFDDSVFTLASLGADN